MNLSSAFALVLAVFSFATSVEAGERAIYKWRQTERTYGAGAISRQSLSGLFVRDLDTNQATEIVCFSFPFRVVIAMPMQNHTTVTVAGPKGSTYTVIAQAESPTPFPGGLLASNFMRGQDASVTVGLGFVRRIPKTMVICGRAISERANEMSFTDVSGKMTLDLRASVESNFRRETFDQAVARLLLLFVAQGYTPI